jgi:diguanylate cyclase
MNNALPLDEFHRILDILQTIDVGLVVLDQNYHVALWNSFMENHSGYNLSQLSEHNMFYYFPNLAEDWLRHKIESVFTLRCASFISWELRPYLFKFAAQRPFTGMSDVMYQNVTIMPLMSRHGEISHVCLIIYDVTDTATSKQALQDANQQLTHLSITDKLTGLYNRGHWEESLNNEFKRYQRTHKTSTLMMLDIDFFKKVNDTYGHTAGDEVLRRTSTILHEMVRCSDIAGRYGGEEFGILLIDVTEKIAWHVAERLRKRIEKECVIFDEQQICFTISIGLAEVNHEQTTALQWLQKADTALYHSKHNGRNQVTLASQI